MKISVSHILVAIVAFVFSVAGTSLYFKLLISEQIPEKPVALLPNESQIPEKYAESESFDELNSLSPYSIEQFINDNREFEIERLWQKLNISEKFNGLPEWELRRPFFGLCRDCKAEISEYDLDDDRIDEVVLRVSDVSAENCRYLIFKWLPSTDNYKLLGHIDHDFGRYQMPKHAFVISGGQRFLIVQVQTQSGSGVAMYYDRLFAVQNGNLVEVLSYPADGHQSSGAGVPQRNFTGAIANASLKNGDFRIEIEFKVKYDTWNQENDLEVPLLSKRQRAVYRKSQGSERAHLIASESNISQAEIDAIYNVDSCDYNDFLKYNRKELKALGRRHDGGCRETNTFATLTVFLNLNISYPTETLRVT